MAMPRSSLSCTAGLHEFGNSILPRRSADWAGPAAARAMNAAASWIRRVIGTSPVVSPSADAVALEGVGIDAGPQPGTIRQPDHAGVERHGVGDDVPGHL